MRLVSVYQCAFNDLCMDCHLYKRRLNFEWTSAEESVEMLRKRTAENYGGMRRYEFSVVKRKNTRVFFWVFFFMTKFWVQFFKSGQEIEKPESNQS